MAKFICIFSDQMDYMQQLGILRYFMHHGFLNVVIITQNLDQVIATTLVSINGKMLASKNGIDTRIMFPDKLIDLQNYQYSVALFNQPPRLILEKNGVRNPLMYFLAVIAQKQNTLVELNLLNDPKEILDVWNSRGMDLTLNSAVSFPSSHSPKLLTYEESAYCALVPFDKKFKKSEIIFFKPFDALTWMILVLTVISLMSIWKLYNGRGAIDSYWLVGVGVIITLIGHGIDISRNNRLILKIVFHLTILMMFILSNIYESFITSFMIQSLNEHRLEQFEQILASDYDIVAEGFHKCHESFRRFYCNKFK